MAGRRPKPTALRELGGNAGHRPLNDSEPKPDTGIPEKPKGMSKAANREWEFIAPELFKLGVLSNIDGKALAAYCDSYALWELARKEINKYGLVVKTPKCDKMGNVIVVQGLGEADPDDPEVVVSKDEEGTVKHGRILYELKANPAVSVYNTMGKLMKSYLIEFGLTPASRSKLKIEKKPGEEDPMAKLLGSREGQEQVKKNAPLVFNTPKPIAPGSQPAAQNSGTPDLAAGVKDSDIGFDA